MKKSKSSVDYTDRANNHVERCAHCEYYIRGGKCEKVRGDIEPTGWCELFSKE